jgi:hypothetical protein
MRGLRHRSDEKQRDTQGSKPFCRSRSSEDVHNSLAVRCSIQPKRLNLAGYEGYREILALEWLSIRLFRHRKARHADHCAVCFLGFCVGEAEVGCTKDISLQNQAGVVVQRRISLGGYQDALGTIGREDPNLV